MEQRVVGNGPKFTVALMVSTGLSQVCEETSGRKESRRREGKSELLPANCFFFFLLERDEGGERENKIEKEICESDTSIDCLPQVP